MNMTQVRLTSNTVMINLYDKSRWQIIKYPPLTEHTSLLISNISGAPKITLAEIYGIQMRAASVSGVMDNINTIIALSYH